MGDVWRNALSLEARLTGGPVTIWESEMQRLNLTLGEGVVAVFIAAALVSLA